MSTNQPHGIPEHRMALHAGQDPTWGRHRDLLEIMSICDVRLSQEAVRAALAKIDTLARDNEELVSGMARRFVDAYTYCQRAAVERRTP